LSQAALRAPPEVALQCVAGNCLLLPSFGLSSSSSSFFFLRLLVLTHFRETSVCENFFPPLFWHNYKIYAKNIYFVGPGGLRAPCMLACAMRSLAIVFTIVQSLLFFFSSSFLAQAACVRQIRW